MSLPDPRLNHLVDGNLNVHGYYQVGDQLFVNKIEALMAGGRSGQQVFWHWHKAYEYIDWTIAPVTGLREIYRRRAQQLRDKYDYLVLSFSGGGDSYTVLHSFLANGIHLDEVLVRWPIKASGKFYRPDNTNHDPKNVLSEWDFTMRPQIEWIRKNHPEIRVNVIDWSDDILAREFDDRDLSVVQEWVNPGVWSKHNAISQDERTQIELGKSTAVIFGIDKPQICVKDGGVYCYFLDILANNHPWYDPGRNSELFFWTADLPELVHVQAHAVYHYLIANPGLANMLEWGRPWSRTLSEFKVQWNLILKSIVYPDDSPDWFQANKNHNNVLVADDWWIWKGADDRYLQSWQNLVDNLMHSVDDRYKNFSGDKVTGWSGFISNLYYIGPINYNSWSPVTK